MGTSDIAFVLEETYEVGEHVEVRIVNNGDRSYRYNSTGYEACELTYRDETGREFIIPPGKHCDLVLIKQIGPGENHQGPLGLRAGGDPSSRDLHRRGHAPGR